MSAATMCWWLPATRSPNRLRTSDRISMQSALISSTSSCSIPGSSCGAHFWIPLAATLGWMSPSAVFRALVLMLRLPLSVLALVMVLASSSRMVVTSSSPTRRIRAHKAFTASPCTSVLPSSSWSRMCLQSLRSACWSSFSSAFSSSALEGVAQEGGGQNSYEGQ